MSLIAVDWDGVLQDPHSRQPIPGAVDGMKALAWRGNRLIIFTARPTNIPSVRADVSGWLHNHGVPFDDICHSKPDADVFLDDRAVRFTTWPAALDEIRSLALHQKRRSR